MSLLCSVQHLVMFTLLNSRHFLAEAGMTFVYRVIQLLIHVMPSAVLLDHLGRTHVTATPDIGADLVHLICAMLPQLPLLL